MRVIYATGRTAVVAARRTLVVLVGALGVSAVPMLADESIAQTECPRPRSRIWKRGEVVVIESAKPAPCTLTFVVKTTGMQTDPDRVPKLTEQLFEDSQGRRYTQSGSGEIFVWNSSDRLLTKFGKSGQGPGEFANGRLSLHRGPNGSLYVFDNNRRWSVLDSNYKLLKTIPYTGGWGIDRVLTLPDGRLVDADKPIGDVSFTVYQNALGSLGGTTLTNAREAISFADVPQSERSFPRNMRSRRLAPSDSNTFWAGPPQATGRGYELQEWSGSGTLLRTIRRQTAWYQRGIDVDYGGEGTSAPPGEIEAIFSFGNGLLLVVARVTNSNGWRDFSKAPQDTILKAKAFDIYVDVIDTNAGVVLASSGPTPIGKAVAMLPARWLQGTNRGYRLRSTASGEDAIQILQAVLERSGR